MVRSSEQISRGYAHISKESTHACREADRVKCQQLLLGEGCGTYKWSKSVFTQESETSIMLEIKETSF